MDTNILFISRNLVTDSPIRSLKEKGYQVIDRSLIQIQPISVQHIPNCDWIFFYSKNGVKYFLEAANSIGFDYHAVKIACLGRQTAEFAKGKGLKVNFTGTGIGESTAGLFAREAAGATVVFPTGTTTLDTVGKRAGNNYTAITISVYDNQPVDSIPITECYLAVLTSPMNVRVFFKYYSGSGPNYIIAIGNTTAAEIAKWTDTKIYIPEDPSEISTFHLIDQIISE